MNLRRSAHPASPYPAACPLLFFVFLALLAIDRRLYLSMLAEDGIVEWATFGNLVAASILSAAIYCFLRRSTRRVRFFGAFSVFCCFLALEEISWGQRLLGLPPPRFAEMYSDQPELNLHNLMQGVTGLKTKRIAGWALFVYGACLPLLRTLRKRAPMLGSTHLVIPPVSLVPSFLAGSIMMCDWPTGMEEEAGEFLYSLCFLQFMIVESKAWSSVRFGKEAESLNM